MDNVQEDMEKKISFPTTYDQHTKQHRVETSGISLIVILNMIEERKEGLDKSKTCCLLLNGLWSSKPIDQTRNYLYLRAWTVKLFATVLWRLCYTVLSASRSSLLSFYPLNVAIDCFNILDEVFWHNLLFCDCSRYFYKLESQTMSDTRLWHEHAVISDNLTKTRHIP